MTAFTFQLSALLSGSVFATAFADNVDNFIGGQSKIDTFNIQRRTVFFCSPQFKKAAVFAANANAFALICFLKQSSHILPGF